MFHGPKFRYRVSFRRCSLPLRGECARKPESWVTGEPGGRQLPRFASAAPSLFLAGACHVSLSSRDCQLILPPGVAAIYEHFPECSLFRRMKVFVCPGTKRFLDTWPDLVSGTACELEEEATIASTFSEANTQTAFMSIAARQKEVETTLRVQTVQLNVLTHRTKPLSPSCKRLGVGVLDSPAPATHGSTSEREEEPLVTHRLHPTPSLLSPPCTHCGHHATSARDSGHPHEQLAVAPGPGAPSPMPPPAAGPVGAGIPPRPVVDVPVMPGPARNDLSVVAINAQNHCF